MMELLCPVGNNDSLRAAVQSGADAVYFGGSAFNARRFAANITDIAGAVSYAHLRGCKVYFTLNTLLLDRELSAWSKTAQDAARAGVDAFILQDLGGANILGQICPDIPLHASTQMSVHHSDMARALAKLGFSRLILARELSARQVRAIKESAGLEVEVFAHGALCFSYSGHCLMSSMLGGRSANRGVCAQPCRLPYSCEDKKGYLLSTKDLCLLGQIKELQRAGVDCIKIEGRMKRAEYVAAVTRAYRKAIDGVAIEQNTREMLALVFNRGGFTEGLFGGDEDRLYTRRPDHIGIHGGKILTASHNTVTVHSSHAINPGDTIAPSMPDAQPTKVLQVREDEHTQILTLNNANNFSAGDDFDILMKEQLTKDLRRAIYANNIKTPVYAGMHVHVDKPTVLEVVTEDGVSATVYGEMPQRAHTRPTTADDIRIQLKKTGDQPFTFSLIEIDMDDGVALPKSAINELRRQAIRALSGEINSRFTNRTISGYQPPARPARGQVSHRLAAQVLNLEQAQAVADVVDILYIPVSAPFAKDFTAGCEVAGFLPLITNDSELEQIKQHGSRFDSLLMDSFVDTGQPKFAGQGFNVTNSETLSLLAQEGFLRVTFSSELNAAQMNDISVPDGMQTEAIVYGHSILMTTANCPVKCDGRRCDVKEGKACLHDRKNVRFPLLHTGTGCHVCILNALPVFMADRLQTVNTDVYRLAFTIESAAECSRIAQIYRSAMDGSTIKYDKEYTRGHFNRGLGVKDEV